MKVSRQKWSHFNKIVSLQKRVLDYASYEKGNEEANLKFLEDDDNFITRQVEQDLLFKIQEHLNYYSYYYKTANLWKALFSLLNVLNYTWMLLYKLMKVYDSKPKDLEIFLEERHFNKYGQ